MNRIARLAPALVAGCLLLTGCPSSSDKQEIARPVASAGAAASVNKGAAVTLDGTGSLAPAGWTGTLAFAWRQTGGTPVTLSDASAARPVFQAPRASGPLTFSLVVTAERPSEAATVVVTVVNRAPVASAGADLAVHGGWLTSLDGSASLDADGDPLSYTWVQLGGPAVILDSPVAGWSRFTAPPSLSTLRFLLVVSDGEASAEDEVAVAVVDPATDQPPVADAGPDQVVPRNFYVSLPGAGYDPDGSGVVSFLWEQLSGSPVQLGSTGYSATWFYAPPEVGDLTFRLTVTSGGLSASDTVTVHVRNVAPTITTSSLTPPHPRTDDELRVAVTTYDPENDPVTLSYAWQRNGAAVAGQVGPTFPASLTTKGDLIAVTVTARDGTSATDATLSATIEDTPAIVGLSFPAEIQHGAAATGQASTVDPDGDPVTAAPVALAFGPPGLAVGPDGTITWTPTLPMFGVALDVHFGVRFAADPASVTTATVRVVDAARAPALRRAAFGVPLNAEALRAVDLDGDGKTELLVLGPNGLGELHRVDGGYAMAWMVPFRPDAQPTPSGDASSAVAATDLDGDGFAEIFYGVQNRLVRLDGKSRLETGHATAASGERWYACEAADVDRDGHAELACLVTAASSSYATDGRLVVLDAATLAVELETATLPVGRSLAVGDVDGDAALEIVTAGGFVYDGATHANEWAYAPGFGAQVEIARPVAGGAAQIIGGSPLRGFSATLKTPLWESSLVTTPFLVRDVDGDGADEFVSITGYYASFQAHRWVGGAAALAQAFSVPLNVYQYGQVALVAGDFDGDGVVEAAWDGATSSYSERPLTIAGPLSAALAVTWQGTDPTPLDGPLAGARLARTGGGAVRVAFEAPRSLSSDGGARVALLDPATGRVATSSLGGSSYGSTSGLAVADYDGDGVDELFLAGTGSYEPRFLAWDPATASVTWTGTATTGGSSSGIAGLAAGDMDADGAPDLVGLAGDGAIWIHDVRDQTLVWKSTALGTPGALALVDLDGDGRVEVVVAAGGRVVAYGWLAAAGTFVEVASVSLTGVVDLAAGDCDADGVPEVYALASDYWGDHVTVTRLDDALQPLGSFSAGRLTSLHVEELGPGRHNLVAGVLEPAASYSSDGLHTLRALDPVSGAEIWRSPPLYGPVTRDAASWFQLGGAWRLAFGTDRSMYLTR